MTKEEDKISAQIHKNIIQYAKEKNLSVDRIIMVGQVASLAGFMQRNKLKEVFVDKLYNQFSEYLTFQPPREHFMRIIEQGQTDGLFEITESSRISLTMVGNIIATQHNDMDKQ